MTDENTYDVFVIGAGINGLGVARDAAGRGLRVGICDKDDLGAHTSSASTKLIHGGLRYLEQYDFALVRKALIEREVLLHMAPHIIWPLRFVLPLGQTSRPAWLVRLGLFLYDHLGGRKRLPATSVVHRQTSTKLDPLQARYTKGFEYSDCWVDDARLCVLNAMDARDRGAHILPRHECVALARNGAGWRIALRRQDGETIERHARTLINAAGPWVDHILGLATDQKPNAGVRLVKGSHIVIDRHYEGDQCYFLQNPDGRIIFAIPYLNGRKTLIGTTDIQYTNGDVGHVEIDQDEIEYLCASASAYFATPITPGDVTSTYSGVRPLYDDQADNASKVTRDYVLKTDAENGAPLISIFGGKITTYRTLAEHVMDLLAQFHPNLVSAWTAQAPLPGGDMKNADFSAFFAALCAQYPAFSRDVLHRYARLYGTRAEDILSGAPCPDALGRDFGGGLYEAELTYLVTNEFAQTAEDILFRRTKLGLTLSPAQMDEISHWLAHRHTDQASTLPAGKA